LLVNGIEPERAFGLQRKQMPDENGLPGFRILIGRQPLGANHNID
jgi:hypothetical protein